ncbi:GerAB/ArcD/ProY family transporter [Cohnella luojiensis]|uniref:Spore gernimation protein n=1 Tax=Cohnella luojiensis TaxID=652876 RepID=A0A4Y8LQ74_9BACL|nr:GerAB/ArcD/ProY family transporter [Cohnella luojiensis]TFE22697.1 spore gernimation protein [Cohnella luojiensis]
MKNPIHEKYLISPFFIVFPMYVSMVGVGILSFQHELIHDAGYNSWISILLVGISIHLILWMIYKILSSNQEAPDVTSINHTCFGKIAGNILNFAIVVYFYFGAFIEFRAYIEIIQVWLFPEMNILPISFILVLFIYYTVNGGFRSVTGLSFWGLVITLILIVPQVLSVLPYRHPLNLLPLLNHSITDIFISSKNMLFQFMGIEALLLFYPFIKTPAKSQKWAHLLVLFVTFLYLVTTISTFMYYSEGQLQHVLWPTLNMLMEIEVPILQRLEYFFISVWVIKIIANISLSLWVASRGMKNALQIRPRASLIVFLAGFLILEFFVNDRSSIRSITEFYSTVGLYFIYVYIPFMFVVTQIRKKVQAKLS